jgi:hypothetical protein
MKKVLIFLFTLLSFAANAQTDLRGFKFGANSGYVLQDGSGAITAMPVQKTDAFEWENKRDTAPEPKWISSQPKWISLQQAHCDSIRQKWKVQYPSRYFPQPPSKLQLWSKTECFKYKSYTVTNAKLAGFAITTFAGLIDGILVGYEFDGRTSFERKYSVSPTGYFGSKSWQMVDNRKIYRFTGAPDFYHTADDVRKFGYISGGIVVGLSGYQVNQKWWHYALDFAASFSLSAASKAAGLYWVRN